MQRLPGTALIGLAALATFAGCSGGGSNPGNGNGGGGSSSPTAPPVVTESYTFPSGDATASSGTAWDITGLKTTLSGVNNTSNNSYNTLRVDVTFAQDISNALPTPGQLLDSGAQLGVGIFLDVDGNPATGSDPSCNSITTATPFEYFSEEGTRLTDGSYSILGTGGAPTYQGPSNPSAEALTVVSGHVFSQTFYLPTLSVFDGTIAPRIGVSADSFNGAQSTGIDCVPKGSAIEVFTTGS